MEWGCLLLSLGVCQTRERGDKNRDRTPRVRVEASACRNSLVMSAMAVKRQALYRTNWPASASCRCELTTANRASSLARVMGMDAALGWASSELTF